MTDLDSATWLDYRQAAKRVNSSVITIQRWRREGMPMGWRVDPRDGQRERVVELDVLLAWWRKMMRSNAVHQAKLRRLAREEGRPVPPWPDAFKTHTRPSMRPDPFEGMELTRESRVRPPAPDPADVDLYARKDLLREVIADLTLTVGGPEFYELQEALRSEVPACDGLTAYTDAFDGRGTKVDDDERALMESICAHCPVIDQCRAFAEVARPAGFWAGQRWPQQSA